MYEVLISPFFDNLYMRKALVSCIALGIGLAPIGLMIILRRMSLMGDSMAHAIFPGTAVGYILAGGSVLAMTIGGIIAGIAVVVLSALVSRVTSQKEDSSFASFYIISLATGFLLISLKGEDEEIIHLLFGNISSVDNNSMIFAVSVSTITIFLMNIFYRPLIMGFLDPIFFKTVKGRGAFYHFFFLILVVFNLVAGYRAMGALMVIGLMLLPTSASRFWANRAGYVIILSFLFTIFSSYIGLVTSYYLKISAGATITLVCGSVYLISVLLGSNNGIYKRYFKAAHLQG